MPIKIEYCCDRCQHTQDTPQNTGADGSRYMHRIAITQQSLSQDHIPPTKQLEVIWCEECMRVAGLRRPLLRAPHEEKKISVEDLIRDIVKQAMESD